MLKIVIQIQRTFHLQNLIHEHLFSKPYINIPVLYITNFYSFSFRFSILSRIILFRFNSSISGKCPLNKPITKFASSIMATAQQKEQSNQQSNSLSDSEFITKQLTELLDKHPGYEAEVLQYRRRLQELHSLQTSTQKTCQEHQKKIKMLKNQIKSMNLTEEEKRNRLKELSRLEKDSKRWMSYFPLEIKGFLNLFIGPADVRMLNPNRRAVYKYVCPSVLLLGRPL